jgi:replication factor A1
MEIKDLQANQGNIDIVAVVMTKDEPRTFEKFGKQGRVANAMIKDETGEVKITLWNDDIDTVNIGDKIHIQNGWCSEYRDEKQLSSGKFGKIEVVGKEAAAAAPAAQEPQEVMTNDPGMMAPEGEVAAPEAPVAEDPQEELEEESDIAEEYIG